VGHGTCPRVPPVSQRRISNMQNLDRFKKTLTFEKVDRLPVMEWASWWNKTIDRWRQEGLPDNCVEDTEIMEYFGLDIHAQFWYEARGVNCPKPIAHGKGVLDDLSHYLV